MSFTFLPRVPIGGHPAAAPHVAPIVSPCCSPHPGRSHVRVIAGAGLSVQEHRSRFSLPDGDGRVRVSGF